MPWYENVLLLNAIKGMVAMLVFAVIAFVLIRPIAYKSLGILLPYERKAMEAAQTQMLMRNRSTSQSLTGWYQPPPPGAVGWMKKAAPGGRATGNPVVTDGDIEIGEGETLKKSVRSRSRRSHRSQRICWILRTPTMTRLH